MNEQDKTAGINSPYRIPHLEWEAKNLEEKLEREKKQSRENLRFWPRLVFMAGAFFAGLYAFFGTSKTVCSVCGYGTAGAMFGMFCGIIAATVAGMFSYGLLCKIFFGEWELWK